MRPALDRVRERLGRSATAQAAYRGVVAGRLVTERWGLALAGPSSPAGGRILAYHSVGTPGWGVNDVHPAAFERHLQTAVDAGWGFATPAEVMAHPERKQLAITFDDGLTSVLLNALPVLRHHGVPATMFVVTGWADGHRPGGHLDVLDWKGVAALQEAGVALGSHSVSHPNFRRLDEATTRSELEESRHRLGQVTGLDVTEFAIPFGQSKDWTDTAARAAADAGYTTVYAQSVDTRPAGTVARTFITRIDRPRIFRAALAGAYDGWEEWYIGPRVDATDAVAQQLDEREGRP